MEEQQRLRNSLSSVDEAAARRMRSMVTHKRLKEIALAQADEVRRGRGEELWESAGGEQLKPRVEGWAPPGRSGDAPGKTHKHAHLYLTPYLPLRSLQVRALAAELDRLRLRTFPTFVEPAYPPSILDRLPADTRPPFMMASPLRTTPLGPPKQALTGTAPPNGSPGVHTPNGRSSPDGQQQHSPGPLLPPLTSPPQPPPPQPPIQPPAPIGGFATRGDMHSPGTMLSQVQHMGLPSPEELATMSSPQSSMRSTPPAAKVA